MNKIKMDWLNYQYDNLNIDNKKRLQFTSVLDKLSNQHHDIFFKHYMINILQLYPQNSKNEIIEKIKLLENDEDTTLYCINNDIISILTLIDKYKFNKDDCDILYRLMNWDPIIQLSGEDEEWVDYSVTNNEIIQQNKRYGEVFRKNNDNSTAYWTNKKIFSNDGGRTWFTNNACFINITFPFTVPDYSEKVYLDKDGNDITYNKKLIEKMYNESLELEEK